VHVQKYADRNTYAHRIPFAVLSGRERWCQSAGLSLMKQVVPVVPVHRTCAASTGRGRRGRISRAREWIGVPTTNQSLIKRESAHELARDREMEGAGWREDPGSCHSSPPGGALNGRKCPPYGSPCAHMSAISFADVGCIICAYVYMYTVCVHT
jgi:hypothetical protein